MKGYILFCGDNSNPEVTLLLNAAEKLNIDLKVVAPRKITVMLDPDCKHLLVDGTRTAIPDFVLSAFANDPSYSNMACLQQLETMGVLCVNRASVMQKTKDKLLTLQLLSEKGIPVPKTILYTKNTTIKIIEEELGFPLVLKVIGGSKGDGVVLIDTPKHLEDVLLIANGGQLQEELILQQFISTSMGTDLRVVVSGGKAVCCAQRVAAKGGFKSNHATGGSTAAYTLDKMIIEIADKTAKALGLFVGGIDLLFAGDGFVVCEANSIPGFYSPEIENPWGIDIPYTFLESIKNELN